jgi:hypothetical protein
LTPGLLLRGLLSRIPACVLCGSKFIRLSGRPYGALISRLGLEAYRCKRCQRRFPLPRRVALSEVNIQSVIPEGNPQKHAIEDAFHRALRGVSGTWTVAILIAPQGNRWLVTLRGPRETLHFSFSPDEQNAVRVQERVASALRTEGLCD